MQTVTLGQNLFVLPKNLSSIHDMKQVCLVSQDKICPVLPNAAVLTGLSIFTQHDRKKRAHLSSLYIGSI